MNLRTLAGVVALVFAPCALCAADPIPNAINQLGMDLLRESSRRDPRGSANALLSPYSITSALALVYVGADGTTRDEMQRVLRFPGDDVVVLAGLTQLTHDFAALQESSRRSVEAERQRGEDPNDPITLTVANRLFAQEGFDLRPEFVTTLRDKLSAPLVELDFRRASEPARATINGWIAETTHDRIRDLIPGGAITADTRIDLANALYLQAPWAEPFQDGATRNEKFWVRGTTAVDVATMSLRASLQGEKRADHVALALRYAGGDLQFVILLPDARDGLARLESAVTPAMLAECVRLPWQDVMVQMPKFKLEPPPLALGMHLRALGMRSAFDQPPRSANFDRMAPRRPDDYLGISEVFHKSWLSLDESGTEAAAATVEVLVTFGGVSRPKPPPLEIHVDRPFLFAIQHVPSGTCLFLGRVVDPR